MSQQSSLLQRWSLHSLNRKSVLPPIPNCLTQFGLSLNEVRYSSRFGRTKSDVPFFRICISGTEREGSAAIFLSENFKQILVTSEEWHLDGTFKTCQKIDGVKQILTIMALAYDHLFPAATILMDRKTVDAYKAVLQAILSITPGVAAVCKKAASLGIRPLLRENEHAKKVVKMTMALPFLPANKIRAGFVAIQERAALHNVEEPLSIFLQYVETTWVRGKLTCKFLNSLRSDGTNERTAGALIVGACPEGEGERGEISLCGRRGSVTCRHVKGIVLSLAGIGGRNED
ncbi:Hypothetical predicted protein [Olea europaea subsp. europaea]|uniref:Uncharacterized protein n=1 Tax=Olea europaea subsp. europaea TaxID=158383 RepID=A0A8S0VH01_OLEEU|nr:Hypothetical predicted protein [Olea europaea subsp. europaea]